MLALEIYSIDSSVRTLELLCAILLLACSCWGEVVVAGRVVDDRGSPVGNAQLSVTSASEPTPVTTSTDPTGSFELKFSAPGPYLLSASKEGFSKSRIIAWRRLNPSWNLFSP